jgi:soluble lytic murein transglycosylase-like protein
MAYVSLLPHKCAQPGRVPAVLRATSRPARVIRGLLLVSGVLTCIAAANPAQAQIFSWRDANGNLVLSNRKPSDVTQAKAYNVPQAPSVRATRYAPLERSRMYDDLIAEHARLNGIRSDLVRAVVQVESAFNPYAKSPKGAMGLMQLMPETARQYGVTNAFNPVENIRAGVAYLRALLDRYRNNEELALAAYNAGPGAVDKHGQNVPPYRETRDYVAQINHMAGRAIEMRAGMRIYKVVEVIDGRELVRYTDQKPTTGTYELVTR